jgi:hypothetical protein
MLNGDSDMINAKHFCLAEMDWPEFDMADIPPRPDSAEFNARIAKLYQYMGCAGYTHTVVYGDREHFASLQWLTGFDPRFEESILILQPSKKPLLLVGLECEGYLPISPVYMDGSIRTERYLPLSLVTMNHEGSRQLGDIFAGEGIGKGSRVGCIGWKYYTEAEHADSRHAIEIPSFMVDTLRKLAGFENVLNATDLLINPNDGLKTYCSANDIAWFEYTNVLASEGVRRMLFGMREGMTDHDVIKFSEFNGVPLGCHMTVKTGKNRIGLTSPIGETLRRGQGISVNISYWGCNICRVGWLAFSEADLPPAAQDYVQNFAGPYFEAMSQWFAYLKIDADAAEIYERMAALLPFDKYGVVINPGHLTHMDEWVSSPFYPGSTIRLHSGMTFQSDVIPNSPVYYSTRMEDGLVLADSALQTELKERFPACYRRCMKRREFMIQTLGINLPEDILPFSNIPGIVSPFFFSPNTVFCMQ